MKTIYLDNNATTPVLPEVFEAMTPYLTRWYGNASSQHHQGARMAAALREARGSVARFLGCTPGELVFTSCGTESNNLAIRGVLEGRTDRRHAVAMAVEHPAVTEPLARLEALGYEVSICPVDSSGIPDLDALRHLVRADTALVSAMWANNETGVILPVPDILDIAHARGALVLVDAVQAVGKIPIDTAHVPVDMLSLSAHKFHGPKGVGALFIRRGVQCNPFFLGGSQERGRRPGTENVAGAVGLACACEQAAAHLDDYATRVGSLRDQFEKSVLNRVADSYAHGSRTTRLPNTSSICFRGVEGRSMLVILDEMGICASAGSACKSGAGKPSRVLTAMGVSNDDSIGTVRFSLSSLTTPEEMETAIEAVAATVVRLRASASQAAG